MIISTLKRVVSDENRTRTITGQEPIKNPYQLYNEMKQKNLKVSRSILTKLWNDTPAEHTKEAKHASSKYKNSIANSITFSTLNKLVKFFDRPVSAFISYASKPTKVILESSSSFIQNHNLKKYHLQKADFPKGSTVIIIVDFHKDKITKQSGKHVFLAIATSKIIKSGMLNLIRCFSIRYSKIIGLYKSPYPIENYSGFLFDIIKHLNRYQRCYLDECIICNKSSSKHPNYDIHANKFIPNKVNKKLNKQQKLDRKLCIINHIPFWYSNNSDKIPVNVADDFGFIQVETKYIRNPILQLLLPDKKDKNSHDKGNSKSSYNFIFINKDFIQYKKEHQYQK